jgi:hypothetical protein
MSNLIKSHLLLCDLMRLQRFWGVPKAMSQADNPLVVDENSPGCMSFINEAREPR